MLLQRGSDEGTHPRGHIWRPRSRYASPYRHLVQFPGTIRNQTAPARSSRGAKNNPTPNTSTYPECLRVFHRPRSAQIGRRKLPMLARRWMPNACYLCDPMTAAVITNRLDMQIIGNSKASVASARSQSGVVLRIPCVVTVSRMTDSGWPAEWLMKYGHSFEEKTPLMDVFMFCMLNLMPKCEWWGLLGRALRFLLRICCLLCARCYRILTEWFMNKDGIWFNI